MTKVEQTQIHLEHLLNKTPPGTKLPTVRQLLREYEVSIATLNKAIANLRADGRLTVVQGSGIYAGTQARQQQLQQVDILYFGSASALQEHGFIRDLLHSLSIAFGEDNISTKLIRLEPYATLPEIMVQLRQLALKGVILVSPTNVELINYLSNRKIPYCSIVPLIMRQIPNSIYIDDNAVMRLLLRHLTAHGHREIGFLHLQEPGYFLFDRTMRQLAFYEECAACGIMPRPELVRFLGYTEESAREAFAAMLDSGRQITAVIANDHTIGAIYRELERRGMQPGREISIVGIDNLEKNQMLTPRLTTVNLSRMELARQGKMLLEKCFKEWSDKYPPIFIRPQLIDGETVSTVMQTQNMQK